MDRKTERAVEDIFQPERSFYDRADALLRLLSPENVSDVMALVPLLFRRELMRFASEAYLPAQPLLVVSGAELPPQCIAAVREWLRREPTERRAAVVPAALGSVAWNAARDLVGGPALTPAMTCGYGEH